MRYIFIVSLFIFLVFGSVSCQGAERGSAPSYGEPTYKAVDFALEDLEGNTITLSGYFKERVVVLVFTTTWCPACIYSIPQLKQLYEEYKDKNVELLAIYAGESKQKVQSTVRKYDIPYKVLLDEDGFVASSYGVRGVPTMMVVDKEGTIRHTGHRVDHRLKDTVNELLR